MKINIHVPPMGESISEATIGAILVASGSLVKVDAEIIELETDKVNQVLYAPGTGEIQWNVKTGDLVKIGQLIGFVGSETMISGENKTETKLEGKKDEKISEKKSEEKKEEKKEEKYEENVIKKPSSSFISATSAPVRAPSSASSASTSVTSQLPIRETRRPLSKIRKVIAKRLVEAQQTMAMLTTFNEVDMTQVIQLREKYKEEFMKKHGCKLGFMSFFVKAVVSALKKFPDLNSYLDGDDNVHREYYDIGVAVGTDRGVIVPVIRDCDQLSFARIEQGIENFAKQAKEGTISAADLQGGGFTITNGGIYGSLLSTPILLPPQCGILGMHKIEKRAVVINDEIVIRSMMYLALSYDHRMIDGKEAVTFLVHIKNILEEPSRLLLEI